MVPGTETDARYCDSAPLSAPRPAQISKPLRFEGPAVFYRCRKTRDKQVAERDSWDVSAIGALRQDGTGTGADASSPTGRPVRQDRKTHALEFRL